MARRTTSKARRAARDATPTLAGVAPEAAPDPDPPEVTSAVVPRLASSNGRQGFLLVLSGPQLGKVVPLVAGRAVVIGRRDDCDLALRDEGVSRRHASVEVRGDGAVRLRDLGSANGTWVDGKRAREATLADGARIQVGGQTTLKFVWADELEAVYQVRLAEGALVDPLTGLHNRRYLEERLGSELAAAQRHGRPVSVLLCDLDHFKAINDGHGHLAGDEALKTVALVLRGAVRKEDVLARYGGEEFVVVARETAMDGALTLAERVRCAVEKSRCAWRGEDLEVTVSVGVTVSAGFAGFVPGRTELELLDAADRALYLAKQGGRNRVVALKLEARARAIS